MRSLRKLKLEMKKWADAPKSGVDPHDYTLQWKDCAGSLHDYGLKPESEDCPVNLVLIRLPLESDDEINAG